MKPKRIKAEKHYDDPGNYYVISQSDIRALAEQMADEHVDFWNQSQDPYRNTVNIMLRVLKRHGMTPGRKERAK